MPHERTSKSPEFQLKAATSRDPVRVSASSRSDFKLPTDASYVPVDDRNKLLGYSLSLDPPRSKSMTEGEDRGATTGGETADPLSQRVAKLLTDANELGSTLHQSTVQQRSLGYDRQGRFPEVQVLTGQVGNNNAKSNFLWIGTKWARGSTEVKTADRG